MQTFDNFRCLQTFQIILDNIPPNEDFVVSLENWNTQGINEVSFVKRFYSLYVRDFGYDFICSQVVSIENDIAKLWAVFALKHIPHFIEVANEVFQKNIEELHYRLNLPLFNSSEVFRDNLPFMTSKDIFKFAFDNLDSPFLSYFYILLILWYEEEYPKDHSQEFPKNYSSCSRKEKCRYHRKCRGGSRCFLFEKEYGTNYDFSNIFYRFQRRLTSSYLSAAPSQIRDKALVKLYESLQQINQTGFFEEKFCLSYDKVLYKDGKPLTGSFYLRWDKVEFFNGFYIVKHPDVPFNKVPVYRVEDKSSRRIFNEISKLFLKKLPPLFVESKKGQIVKILNQSNLSSCIAIMEHKVIAPNTSRKKNPLPIKFEKKDLSKTEVQVICKEFKSRYLNYLCAKQLDMYKVVCCIEHRVNATGGVSSEYSFIFTVKETSGRLFLAYENASNSRCTYILPISRSAWQESIDKIYEFFASNEVNKRQLLASRLVDLELPGDYEYKRVFHTDYLAWVDRIKYCQ